MLKKKLITILKDPLHIFTKSNLKFVNIGLPSSVFQ